MTQYRADDLIRLAKRENNSRRDYLYVNPLQGKHMPSNPVQTMEMCRSLAEKIEDAYPDDRLYVIGFAETATGIAAGVCHFLKNIKYYQTTTREPSDEKVIHFTESHSHATEQTLRTNGIRTGFASTDRIVFIDDEVTTGNTICKLIKKLTEQYGSIKCTIASLLNSMPQDRIKQFEDIGVKCISLVSIPNEYRHDMIDSLPDNTITEKYDVRSSREVINDLDIKPFHARSDTRFMTDFINYDSECEKLMRKIEKDVAKSNYEKILFLGTEEFMYQTIFCGAAVENLTGKQIRVQSTTRSPILTSSAYGYPITNGYIMRSLYEEGRKTFLYDVKKYDKVYIFTDAILSDRLNDIGSALAANDDYDITVINWKYD